MPKRTSNSSVNSSIRQQTKSNEEGMGNLIAAQQAALGELSTIRQILQLSKDHEKLKKNENGGLDTQKVQERILDVSEQQLSGSRKYWKTRDEMDRIAQEEATKIGELAKAMNTTGNFLQKLGGSLSAKKEGVKEKFGIANGGLKKTVLGALNVGGIFNKTLAKDAFKAKQKALGNDVTDEDAEGAYKTSKEIKEHDKKISALKAKHGISDEEFAASKTGKEMLDKKEQLANVYRSYDKSAKAITPDPTERDINFDAVKKTPTETAAENTQNEEMQMEGAKAQEKMSELLAKIEENTRPAGGKGVSPEKVAPAGGLGAGLMLTGLLDMLSNFLGDGFMKAVKAIFNPKNMLKALGKAFVITAVIGALFEGFMDGFNEYMESGDIGKALIAGLAGIVDFLTFGLFDKDAIKEVIGDMAAWTNDHIVKPVSEFFTAMKNGFLTMLSKIGIPEITLLDNKLTGKVAIGPYYPFADMAPKSSGSAKPEAAVPQTANAVDQKSADNAAAAVQSGGEGNKTNVVNAPVTNNTTQNQVIRAPIRNQDSSANTYMNRRYA